MIPQIDQSYEGFAQANLETLEMLQKALTAGSGVDAAAFTGGRALTPESLDTTLVNILHEQDDARLFKKLKKQPVKSAVRQWDDRTEVGSDDGAWVTEGADSEEADQTIARKYQTAKYLQTLRKVTLQASISDMIEDAVSIEKNAGTLWIIRNVERMLFYGNSSLISVQPDGLLKQIPAANVIDIRGDDATTTAFEDAMNEGCRIVRDSYGKVSDMFISTMVMQDVQKLIRDRILFNPGLVAQGGSAIFTKYPTPFGSFDLVDDIFVKEKNVPRASTLTAKRPGAPTIVSAVPGVDPLSKFAAGDAGDYVYKVVGVNQYGDSLPSAEVVVSGPGVAAGDAVVITITNGSPVSVAYKIYRSKKGGASGAEVREMMTVPVAATVTDYNNELPGTSQAFMLTLDTVYNAIEWMQFLPLMKFDLYPTSAAVYPFLMLLFGNLIVKKPVQHAIIKNISPSGLGWF